MTIGNFNELLGIGLGYSAEGFDSLSGSDLQILYALNGDDVLNTTTTFLGGNLPNGNATTILVERISQL